MKFVLSKRTLRVLALLIVFILLLLCSCKEETVYPPVRTPKDRLNVQYVSGYTLDEAYEKADVVATVKIENWLSEDEESSFFEAKVLEAYKGEPEETIRLAQSGNSQYMIVGHPLYYPENEFFIFLNEYENSQGEKEYCSLQDADTLFTLTENKEGEKYITAGHPYIKNSIPQSIERFAVTQEMKDYLCKDPYWENEYKGDWSMEAFALNDILNYLKS